MGSIGSYYSNGYYGYVCYDCWGTLELPLKASKTPNPSSAGAEVAVIVVLLLSIRSPPNGSKLAATGVGGIMTGGYGKSIPSNFGKVAASG